MSEKTRRYVVHGTVKDANGRELSGAKVVLLWERIRKSRILASGKTTEEGTYRLRYSPPDDAPEPLLILVEVSSPRLRKPLKSSPAAAQPDLLVDLQVEPEDRSEFTTLVRTIEPLLDGLPLSDVVESSEHQDISFLVKETGKGTEQIMRLVAAVRLEEAYEIPAAAFYGFLQQHVPAALPASLLEASQDFTLIEALVRRIASLIFNLTPELQTSTLETAVILNLINPELGKEIPEIVNRLQKHRTTGILGQPYLAGKTTLSQILSTARLSQSKQAVFAKALVTNTQSMRNFWKTLGDGKHGLTVAEASRVQRTLEVGAFVKNHVPLVTVLLDGFKTGTYKSLSDLARISLQDWIKMVDKVGAPANIDNAGAANPAEVFARVIYSRITRAYPTAALASRASTGSFIPPAEREPLNRFFQNNSTIELGKINLTTYLEQNSDKAFTGIAKKDRPAVIANAKSLQRVLRILPEVDTAQTLLSLGFRSATQIASLGREQFFNKATSEGLSKHEANKVFNISTQRYSGLVSLVTQYNRDMVGIWPKAVGQISELDQPTADAIQRNQSLATLFGSQDYCVVDSCTSVLSPAAYLCDLFLWLRNHPLTGTFPNALQVLFNRRPDLGHLLLNCPNTETPLPYIDLVNELLEDAVSPPGVPVWKQTDRSAAELRAAPEYVNSAAYTVLAGASYPHTLPYDSPLDELRTYLQQSNISLWQLRQALLPLHNPTLAQKASVAAERFGLDPHELDLITSPNFVPLATAWNTPTPATDLAPVASFLQAASISYERLLELLDVVWVRGGGAATTLQSVNDNCDLSAMTLSPLDDNRLDRFHRFLRLWRHAGYKLWELDLLLGTPLVGNNVLDKNALWALFTFRQLQDVTHLPVDRQLAFYQDIDLGSHLNPDGTTSTSLFAQLFLNPAVPEDSDLLALQAGTPVADTNISHHLAAIQSALEVSSADADRLFSLTNGQLTIANLSLIYRVITLARTLKVSLTDLQSLIPFTSAATLGGAFASIPATLALIQQINASQQSGFDVDALIYLLTPPPWTTTSGITDTSIATTLAAVRHAILNPSGGDVNGSVIAAVAAQFGIANDITAFLMQQLLVPGTTKTLLVVLTDPALTAHPGGVYKPITRANFPNQYIAIQLLDKNSLMVKQLHLVKADLEWLLVNASVYGGLNFANLPVKGAQTALTLAPLLSTVLLVKLARLFVAAPPQSQLKTLFDVVSAVKSGAIVNEAAAQTALATITAWPVADIVALATATGVSFAGGDYLKAEIYDALRVLEAMVVAFGQQTVGQVMSNLASATQLVSWAQPAPGDVEAGSALGVLKARYSNDDWLKIAPLMMDPIRERRSAGLQAYLLAQRDINTSDLIYGDTNALFDHFLIDVQMSSCEVTTRVIQAYAAVQLFVERCLMGLEDKVTIDLTQDGTWTEWNWMKRYRIWEANRKVFLYPENWLIESQRPNRTEIFQKLEKEVHQNDNTFDYLESVSLNYIDRLDEIANLIVSGTCLDPLTGAIHVVARTPAEPPRYYHRSFVDRAWTGWQQIPLDIKAHQVVPAIYRRRLCLFWADVKVSNEPHQSLPAAQPSTSEPSQEVARYVSIGLDFSIFRNGAWAPAQKAKGRLFDVPLMTSGAVSDNRAVEALYTLKVQTPAPTPGYGASLFIDVFRLGPYDVMSIPIPTFDGFNVSWHDLRLPFDINPMVAVHLGRAVFDGRFSDLELHNLPALLNIVSNSSVFEINPADSRLLTHAQSVYGPDAQSLLPLPDLQADPNLIGEPGLFPQAGALATGAPDPNQLGNQVMPLIFTSASALEQNIGTLLWTGSIPFRVVGPDSDLAFDPTSYFFYQDNRRSYFVESVRYYQWGSAWLPIPPSNPDQAPFEIRYRFHRFYHPYTRLFWHQLSAGGFPTLFNRDLQLKPDTIDPSGADVFNFQSTYHPVSPRVNWSQGENLGEDRNKEIVDFSREAAYSVYNWELFFHTPLYIAERLSQNQKFEDAVKWFHFIFNPTLQGPDPVPQRFWITKPLNSLTSSQILNQRINQLLELVNQGDPNAVAQVASWRKDPFNPFLLADQRPVAYMKRVVMSYLDNLIAWADKLYSTDSREALNEATLLYIISAEILGPQPVAITPPRHADDSYIDLEPKLDAFANAMVDIENVMGGGGGGGGGGNGGGMPAAQTFYFKIPPNDKLLGYWKTVADRLFKLRHCQNIAGVTRQLALFDAPIDPGLLIKAQAAGVDIGSILSDVTAPLPNYRFTSLYPQALDFVNAVRGYGSQLLAALERSDAEALGVLLTTHQRQLQEEVDQILEWKIEEAQKQIESLNQTIALAQAKFEDANTHPWANPAEITSLSIKSALILAKLGVSIGFAIAGGLHLIPNFALGVAGFGGTPAAEANEGGDNAGNAAKNVAKAGEVLADSLDKGSELAKTVGEYIERASDNAEKAKEAQIQIQQAQAEVAAANLRLQMAVQNRVNQQALVDRLQQEIDYLTSKFTGQDLYDWMVGKLSDTYFQSYQLAYNLCKRVERCYHYELGDPDSSFINFGYWDSLKKGLLAGEALNHDLRRMQSSYLDQNSRRFEISRYISLANLDITALVALLGTGACNFNLPESLFDNDYPGHYHRHLVRVSLTIVYPTPGKYDNVKGTLTLVQNSVRISTDLGPGYARLAGTDPRFVDSYGAVPQKIVLGNGQEDPGLFLTTINDNLNDQRYLPFEGAGAISSWHLEMLAANNEIDLTKVSDVIMHIYYTALDGGDALKAAA
jgi:hypothetical protein